MTAGRGSGSGRGPRPGRPLGRWRGGRWRWVALALLVVPLLELWVVLQVGELVGAPVTVALLLAVSVGGAWLLRREGTAAWRAFQGALRAGRPPAREVADGVLVLVGGTLLLTPGFLTDAVGLALVLPGTRALARRLLVRRLAGRLVVGTAVPGLAWPPRRPPAPGGGSSSARRPPAGGRGVVPGEVVDRGDGSGRSEAGPR